MIIRFEKIIYTKFLHQIQKYSPTDENFLWALTNANIAPKPTSSLFFNVSKSLTAS